jgi:hypothetical protein
MPENVPINTLAYHTVQRQTYVFGVRIFGCNFPTLQQLAQIGETELHEAMFQG